MFKPRDTLDSHLNLLLTNPKFLDYYETLIQANQSINLTRIIEQDDVYYKHFYDSIILTKYFDLDHKTLLDVGAGAGFPSIPLRIVNDHLEVTLVDSLNKRIAFLASLIDRLDLDHVILIHGRAEELTARNSYDFVTSRAVARLNTLIELTLPFVKVGGYFIAYKSSHYKAELNEALNGIKVLGGTVESIKQYSIGSDEKHVLIIIKKVKETPALYPRAFGKIKKNPL